MAQALNEAMREILAGWHGDLDPHWRPILDAIEPAYDAVDPSLTLEPWEPVFPPRRGRAYPGAPKGAHMLRGFDGIAPEDVRVVILGQDPYPCAAFATGRAFEAGNVARWRELEKMFSKSIRTWLQLVVAARTGDARYAASVADWDRTIADIEAGRIAIESAAEIMDPWVAQGVLLLNSSFTLSRFQVAGDPHQVDGHLPLWRPVVAAVLRHLAARGTPTVFMAFGGQAEQALAAAGIAEGIHGSTAAILREHPAFAEKVLALENPVLAGNAALAALGAAPIRW